MNTLHITILNETIREKGICCYFHRPISIQTGSLAKFSGEQGLTECLITTIGRLHSETDGEIVHFLP